MSFKQILTYVSVFCVFGAPETSEPKGKLHVPLGTFETSTEESPWNGLSALSAYVESKTYSSPRDITRVTVTPSSNLDCQTFATDYAYRNNLCLGASNPESYLVKAKSRYTCFSRCGETPKPSEDIPQCGCDALCTAFRDCCQDMAEMCPRKYDRGHNPALSLEPHISKDCDDFVTMYGQWEGFYSTTTSLPSNTTEQSDQVSDWYILPGSLQGLRLHSKMFQVVDLISKLLYRDIMSHTRFSSATSVPVYVPKVASLACSSTSRGDSSFIPSALTMLPSCRIAKVQDVVTPYHRPCREQVIQRCPCVSDNRLVEHVHNSCLGRNLSRYRQYRFPMWDRDYAKFDKIPYGYSEGCGVVRATSSGAHPYIPTKDKKPNFTMRFTPILQHSTSQPVAAKGENMLGQKTATQDRNPELDLDFTVEFTNTLEERFLCPQNLNYLKNCRLVRCVAGALLWVEDLPQTSDQPPRSCILTSQAKVSIAAKSSPEVPLCTCLQVLAVLNGLDLWRTKIEGHMSKGCVIGLVNMNPRKPTYFKDTYKSMKPGLGSSPDKNQVDSKTIRDLLVSSSQFCPDEIHQTFKICFLTTSVGDGSKSSVCLTWSGVYASKLSGAANLGNRALHNLVHLVASVLCLCLINVERRQSYVFV